MALAKFFTQMQFYGIVLDEEYIICIPDGKKVRTSVDVVGRELNHSL